MDISYIILLKTLVQNSSETKLHFDVYCFYHRLDYRWNAHFNVIHNLTVFSDKQMVNNYEMTMPPIWRNYVYF